MHKPLVLTWWLMLLLSVSCGTGSEFAPLLSDSEIMSSEATSFAQLDSDRGSRHYYIDDPTAREEALHFAYDVTTGQTSWRYNNLGDTNLDGIVNVADLTPLGCYFQIPIDDNDELQWVDADANGQIALADVAMIGMYFGVYTIKYQLWMADIGTTEYQLYREVDVNESASGWPPTFRVSLPANRSVRITEVYLVY